MAQTFTSTEVVTTTNVFADNQSQRTNENTLRSNFSGATQPSDPVVGQQWYDTAKSKTWQYNGSAWVPIDTNSTTQVDVSNAKGSLTNLTSYLRVAHNDDGTLKTSPATAIDEFKDNALAITYVSTSSFTVHTDLTSIFTTNRKVKVYLDVSTAISYVSSSSYDGGANKTTVVLGGTVLDSSVTAVKYSVIQYGERQDTVHTSDLSTYARLESPEFMGTPTAPTAASGTSTTQLATTDFVQMALKKAGGVPIGTITARLSKKPEAGELALDTGALVSRATYPDLWAWVQANAPLLSEADWQAQAAAQTSVGAYSTGDGNTTFRLPRLLDYFRGGKASDVGTWQGDAIRNITGSHTVRTSGGAFATGVFVSAGTGSGAADSGSNMDTVKFDASRVVPTADENRPKTIKVLYCVKAFDAETNPGLIDITALANEMAGKVDKTTYAADFAKGINSNGYQKLPSGLIIQWGRVSVGADASNVTFPLAFPSNCFSLVSDRYGLADNTADLGVLSYSSTGFSCNPNGAGTWSYIAIGI